MKHIKGLDTLRAFAVFFVIVEHTGVWFDTTVLNGRFIKDVIIPDGGFGVHLFFVLSGFLITSILLKEKSRTEGKERFTVIKNFFVRRALRIFPAYYLLLFFLFKIDYQCIRHDLAWYMAYLGNVLCYRVNAWTCFCHSWTLGVEEQFYLIWPWIILFINKKHLNYIFYSAIIIGVVSTWYCMSVTGHIAPFLVFNCFDAFGIGGLYAYARLNERSVATFSKAIRYLVPLAICVYAFMRITLFLGHPWVTGLFMYKTVNSVLAVWLIMLVVNDRSTIFAKYFLENRFLNFIGRISYGIYLYHYVYNGLCYDKVVNFLDRISQHSPTLNYFLCDSHYNYWIQIAIIVFISWLSFVLVEKPILSIKRFFKYEDQ